MRTKELRVRLFAAAREAFGREEVVVRIPLEGTVADLLRHLEGACPAGRPLLRASRVAVDLEFAGPEAVIPARAEVALIPPVSGG